MRFFSAATPSSANPKHRLSVAQSLGASKVLPINSGPPRPVPGHLGYLSEEALMRWDEAASVARVDANALAALEQALRVGDYRRDIFSHPAIDALIFEARAKGLITDAQQLTLLFFVTARYEGDWSLEGPCAQFHLSSEKTPVSTYRLVDSLGQWTASATRYLKRIDAVARKLGLPPLDSAALQSALNSMPLSEQYLFHVPKHWSDCQAAMLESVATVMPYLHLGKFSGDVQFASASVLKAIFEQYSPAYFRMQPVFGRVNARKYIDLHAVGIQPLACFHLAFAGHERAVHGTYPSRLGELLHDVSHAFMCGLMPKPQRELLFLYLLPNLKALIDECSGGCVETKDLLNELCFLLGDLNVVHTKGIYRQLNQYILGLVELVETPAAKANVLKWFQAAIRLAKQQAKQAGFAHIGVTDEFDNSIYTDSLATEPVFR